MASIPLKDKGAVSVVYNILMSIVRAYLKTLFRSQYENLQQQSRVASADIKPGDPSPFPAPHDFDLLRESDAALKQI